MFVFGGVDLISYNVQAIDGFKQDLVRDVALDFLTITKMLGCFHVFHSLQRKESVSQTLYKCTSTNHVFSAIDSNLAFPTNNDSL